MSGLRILLVAVTVFAGLFTDGARLALPKAEAAQPWYCTCDGKSKRHLASTRHCEFQMGVPKGQSCTSLQWRLVYGPACRARGCYLPWRL